MNDDLTITTTCRCAEEPAKELLAAQIKQDFSYGSCMCKLSWAPSELAHLALATHRHT